VPQVQLRLPVRPVLATMRQAKTQTNLSRSAFLTRSPSF
jgi:hypothetical protein